MWKPMSSSLQSIGRRMLHRENRPGAREPDVDYAEFGNSTTESARGAVADAHGHKSDVVPCALIKKLVSHDSWLTGDRVHPGNTGTKTTEFKYSLMSTRLMFQSAWRHCRSVSSRAPWKKSLVSQYHR